jgi:hypothetical protein
MCVNVKPNVKRNIGFKPLKMVCNSRAHRHQGLFLSRRYRRRCPSVPRGSTQHRKDRCIARTHEDKQWIHNSKEHSHEEVSQEISDVPNCERDGGEGSCGEGHLFSDHDPMATDEPRKNLPVSVMTLSSSFTAIPMRLLMIALPALVRNTSFCKSPCSSAIFTAGPQKRRVLNAQNLTPSKMGSTLSVTGYIANNLKVDSDVPDV